MAALPDRDQLAPGYLFGAVADHLWRVDVLPFTTQDAGSRARAQWVPQTVVVTVQAPSGAAIKIDTVRLRRGDNK
jgi:hypothetical protein